RVEHDRAHDPVGDHGLRPDDRVRLGAVAREHGGRMLARSAVHNEGEVEPAAGLESGRDAGGFEALRCGHAHGATPSTLSPMVSGRPSAMFADWIAAPAVPLPRLSRAVVTTTRPAAS